MVKTVYKNLIERGERAPLKITSELTEVPYPSVRRIVSRDDEELARKQTVRSSIISKLGETGIEEIKALIYGMYDAKQVPTIATIKTHLLEKSFPANFSEETLRIILHRVGFTYKKLNKRCAIMQTPRLITWRTEYIRKIRQFRSENRNIVYLDETWYDTHDVITRGWVDDSKKCRLDTPVARGKRIIILAAGNERGFIPGTFVLSTKNIRDSSADYHDDMNHQVFEDWLKNYLLPQLEPNSVIVMDNAPYHSRQDRKIPNMGTKKADMVTFMEEENIPVPDERSTKKELLNIILNSDIDKEKSYTVDKLARENGHEVLRLPPYYCILNPIELVWSQLKHSVRKGNLTPSLSDSVVRLIRKEADNVTGNLWKNCIKHVIQCENAFLSESEFPEIIINLNDSEESDFDEDE